MRGRAADRRLRAPVEDFAKARSIRHANKVEISWFLIICLEANGSM
jgi:hypothetical protein